MARRRIHQRSAFTAVEMLAAAALTAVLMAAVLHVVASVGRTRRAMEAHDQQGESSAWKADLLDGLRWDLTNATSARFEPGRLTLDGHGALDPQTMSPGHEPATVVYEVATLGGRPWLVRRQGPRDSSAGGRSWSDLVCPDVTRFDVEPAAARPGGAARSVEAVATPARVRIRIEGPAGPIADGEIVLR